MLESHKLDNIKYLAGKESDGWLVVKLFNAVKRLANSRLTVFIKALIKKKMLEEVSVKITSVICVLNSDKGSYNSQVYFARAVAA